MLTAIIAAALPAVGDTYATPAHRESAARAVATEAYRRIIDGEADEWLAAVTRARDDARLQAVSERATAHWAEVFADEAQSGQLALVEA